MDERTDDALVLAARQGDADAAEAIVRRYARRLGGYLYRMTGETHESEDLMQETLARFFGAIDDYRPEGKLQAYLFRIASNLAAHAWERRRRRPEPLAVDSPDPAPGPDVRAMGRLELSELERALGTLGFDQRQALLLKVHEGLSYEEIASIQGTSTGAVKVRVFRARESLRTRVDNAAGMAWRAAGEV